MATVAQEGQLLTLLIGTAEPIPFIFGDHNRKKNGGNVPCFLPIEQDSGRKV
jgi:hypothetical protein